MKVEDFNLLVDKIQERCKSVLVEKARHYAGETNRLENFVRAGDLQNETPAMALHGMLVKHEVSIAMMIENPLKHNKKTWDEKITDSINYLILLEAVLIDMGIE